VDPRGSIEGSAATITDLRQIVPLLQVRVAAGRTALHGRGHQVMRGLDGVRAKIEIDLVDAIAPSLVVDQGPRAKLRDGQEAWTRDKFVAASPLAPARDVGRERQTREVVAREEALCGEVAVGIKVPFVDAFRFSEQANLAFCLGTQTAGLIALGLRTCMIT